MTVDLIQPTGARSLVDFRLGGVEVTAEMGAYDAMRPGQDLAVDVEMPKAILIDAATFLASAMLALCWSTACPAQPTTLDPAIIAFRLPEQIKWTDNPADMLPRNLEVE